MVAVTNTLSIHLKYAFVRYSPFQSNVSYVRAESASCPGYIQQITRLLCVDQKEFLRNSIRTKSKLLAMDCFDSPTKHTKTIAVAGFQLPPMVEI
jgi:hypothetical protein